MSLKTIINFDDVLLIKEKRVPFSISMCIKCERYLSEICDNV